jgi:hypothetical protein
MRNARASRHRRASSFSRCPGARCGRSGWSSSPMTADLSQHQRSEAQVSREVSGIVVHGQSLHNGNPCWRTWFSPVWSSGSSITSRYDGRHRELPDRVCIVSVKCGQPPIFIELRGFWRNAGLGVHSLILYKTLSAAVYGVEASIIEVEVDVSGRAALKNCGYDLPPTHITINLAPCRYPQIGCSREVVRQECCEVSEVDIDPTNR